VGESRDITEDSLIKSGERLLKGRLDILSSIDGVQTPVFPPILFMYLIGSRANAGLFSIAYSSSSYYADAPLCFILDVLTGIIKLEVIRL
jgi:hypothetical protein